jgi:hypothetical protein
MSLAEQRIRGERERRDTAFATATTVPVMPGFISYLAGKCYYFAQLIKAGGEFVMARTVIVYNQPG